MMKICKTKTELRETLEAARRGGKTVGLVPTMGALHEGHASLFKRARAENDIFVASVFVNPIQFNNADDLKNYPRDFEADKALLEREGCDVVFHPEAEEMYPAGVEPRSYSFGALESVMEGAQRPGHFKGVGVVVGMLFELVEPTCAYFGEKDFQQVAVIKDMVRQMRAAGLKGSGVEIVPCPIKRGEDGLALSSRNALLTPENRAKAPLIYAALHAGAERVQTHPDLSCAAVKSFVESQIGSHKEMKLEYFEIADRSTLRSVPDNAPARGNQGFIVVWMGNVRLIDNIRL